MRQKVLLQNCNNSKKMREIILNVRNIENNTKSTVHLFKEVVPNLVSAKVGTLYSVSQKTIHLTFNHNFGKCRPIFKKFFH